MTDALNRHLAPVSDAGWAEIERAAKETLVVWLAGRKLVDFTGPLGWAHAATPTGKVDVVEGFDDAVLARRREVQPLLELRSPFLLSRAALESVDRGNPAPELGPLVEAARRLASAEDTIVFDGAPGAGIPGMHRPNEDPLILEEDFNAYPRTVSMAIQRLRAAGIDGPYALALGPRCWHGVHTTTTPAGFPVIEHLRRVVDGPIVWAPAVRGALVVSQRGGDFELVVGRDVSIGYLHHTATQVELYLEESLTFRVHAPDAAVSMIYRT